MVLRHAAATPPSARSRSHRAASSAGTAPSSRLASTAEPGWGRRRAARGSAEGRATGDDERHRRPADGARRPRRGRREARQGARHLSRIGPAGPRLEPAVRGLTLRGGAAEPGRHAGDGSEGSPDVGVPDTGPAGTSDTMGAVLIAVAALWLVLSVLVTAACALVARAGLREDVRRGYLDADLAGLDGSTARVGDPTVPLPRDPR